MLVSTDNLLSPPILFFILGLLGAIAHAECKIPDQIAKGLAIYLLVSIGLKGGGAIADSGFTMTMILAAIAGIILSAVMPLLAFGMLRVMSGLTPSESAAVAAHYGSISIVTFITAASVLDDALISYSGGLVAIAALMEAPAIATGLWLAAKYRKEAYAPHTKGILQLVLLNESIFLILGALLVGAVINTPGREAIEPFFITPLQGVLCLFLLDMGLKAGEGLRRDRRALQPMTIAFGIIMPLCGATLALGIAALIGLELGDTVLFMTLAASASYIAVPAAMRLALPAVDPAIYLSLSLGITFPFNILLGISLYLTFASGFIGG